MPEVRQGDTKTYRLTILDGDGSAPPGGTLAWVIEHCVKNSDAAVNERITKSNQEPTEIAPAPTAVNPNENVWDIFYSSSDTDLAPDCYVRHTKVTTDSGQTQHIHRDEWTVLPKGCD